MIKAGTFKAKLVNHGISLTKAGDPQVECVFEVGEDKIKYFGSFKEKAQAYTIKNLITLGLKGNNPADPLENGKEVELVIIEEMDQKGKMRPKVRFINAIGAMKEVVSPELAKMKLANLEGAVVAARQQMAKTQPDEDSIPF